MRLYTAVKSVFLKPSKYYVVPKTWTDPLYVEHCSTFEKKFPPHAHEKYTENIYYLVLY